MKTEESGKVYMRQVHAPGKKVCICFPSMSC